MELGGGGGSREGLRGVLRLTKPIAGGGGRAGVSSPFPAWFGALAVVAARVPVAGGRGGLKSGGGLHLRFFGWGVHAAVNDRRVVDNQGGGLSARW